MILLDRRPAARNAFSHARRSVLLVISIFLFSLQFQTNVSAQDEPDIDVVRVRTDLVTVPVVVEDNHGRRVTDLTLSDFELRDNGRIVKVDYFASGTDRVAMVFALDASGSSRDVITQQREVALALFDRFGKGSEVAVIRFASKPDVVASFTSSRDDVLRAFNLPALSNRPTAIFDAVAFAIQTFSSRRGDSSARQIVVLISDGLDTVSVTTPNKVIEEAKSRGVSIYAVQIPLYTPRDGRLRPRPATRGFREIAEKSGGRFFHAGNEKDALAPRATYDLAPIFHAIEDDLRGQYVFGYYPEEANRDGKYHRLELKVTSKEKRKLRVRLLREGYISKPGYD